MPAPFFDPGASDTQEEYLSRIAAGYVANLAPAPDTEAEGYEDYALLAEAAEYMLYTYLKKTAGISISSRSMSGLSESYVDSGKIQAIVAGAMGAYYTGPTASPSNTAYIGDFV